MARGFLAGVVHGGLLSVVALAGLSLLAPLPQNDVPDAAPPAEPAPQIDVAPTAPDIAPFKPDLGVDQDAPQAGALDLPAGSEFGRGGDIAPVLPALGGAAPRAEPAEPLAIPAQEAEAVPPVAVLDPARPETQADGSGPAQPAVGEEAPDLALPAPLPQEVPRTAPAVLAAPAPEAGQDTLPQVSPEAAATAATSPEDAPRLSSPPLDLSLPPDLTDLRRLERN